MDRKCVKKDKILIVDDNGQNIEQLIGLFENHFKIVAATTGERALKIAGGSTPPDLILTDILMPEMDGYELCSRLKQDKATMNIPVIFVTAVSEVMDAAKGFALGAVDYITKPFHPPMVMARVQLHLDLKRKQELLEEIAFIDALTEIPNRRQFDTVLENEMSRATRSSQNLAVLFMDIDFFKEYNDFYGHGEGDYCLKKVAQVIRGCLKRGGDFTARFGGEEFVVILPYSSRGEAMKMAESITESLYSMNIQHEKSSVADRVTLSIGVTVVSPGSQETVDHVIATVDSAMYLAKRDGRNTIRFTD